MGTGCMHLETKFYQLNFKVKISRSQSIPLSKESLMTTEILKYMMQLTFQLRENYSYPKLYQIHFQRQLLSMDLLWLNQRIQTMILMCASQELWQVLSLGSKQPFPDEDCLKLEQRLTIPSQIRQVLQHLFLMELQQALLYKTMVTTLITFGLFTIQMILLNLFPKQLDLLMQLDHMNQITMTTWLISKED